MASRSGPAVLAGNHPKSARANPALRQMAIASPPLGVMTASAGMPAVVERRVANPIVRVGGALLAVYLFIFFSRILDVSGSLAELHIPMIVLILLMLLSMAAGGLRRLISSRIG